MSKLSSITAELDRLMEALEGAAAAPAEGLQEGDAIDRERNAAPRVTHVRGLRDAPEVEAFRQALIDGLIRTDTANRLLQLLNRIITQWL